MGFIAFCPEPLEEFDIPPSISGYPNIIYPKFPEDETPEPKTYGKRKYMCKTCGSRPTTKKGLRHHKITKHRFGVLAEQLRTLDANGRPLNFFDDTETIKELKPSSNSTDVIDEN
ncbi:hypothetical protein NPIL_644211, partial [Nephila pilipes]